MSDKIKAYRGDDNYIFISYAHKDSESVMPVIEKMAKDGYRVWFDEGIDPGTEWDDNIASHIVGCGYFIAFVSTGYINSSNCKDELNYARDLEKDRLIIYIEDVQLPPGMAMRMNRIQSVFKNKYLDENEFYNTVYSAKNLSNFKGVNRTVKTESASDITESDRGEIQRISFANGEYTGQVRDGKRHGKGIVHYINGDSYDGEWSEGVKSGYGIYTFADGERYEGSYVNGLRCGFGAYFYNSGNVYEGDWKDDKRHGHGVFKWKEGDVYEGDFEEGKMSGQGLYRFANGASYIGGVKDGKKHGEGVYRDEKGNEIKGEWKDGVRQVNDVKIDLKTGITDELFIPAVKFAAELGKISTSNLQRKFKLGYGRAARLVDLMEERGVVGPFNSAKPRLVLVTKEQVLKLLGEQGE